MCHREFPKRANLLTHYRSQNPEDVDPAGQSRTFPTIIPQKKSPRIYCPKAWENELDENTWIYLTKGGGYAYTVNKVKTNILNDLSEIGEKFLTRNLATVAVLGVAVGIAAAIAAMGFEVGVMVGVMVGVTAGITVGVALGLALGVAQAVGAGSGLGLAYCRRVAEGVAVGISVGMVGGVGCAGMGVTAGVAVGVAAGVTAVATGADSRLEYCRHLLGSNKKYHALAQEVLRYVLDNDMLSPRSLDEAGGVLDDGFILRRHGGPLTLSLERRNNDLPHFVKGWPAVGPNSNLRLIAVGLNNAANIICDYGDNTCAFLRGVVSKRVTVPDQKAAWRRVVGVSKTIHNTAYQCCVNVWTGSRGVPTNRFARGPDKECIAAFPSLNFFHRHCLDLWVEQGLVCAVSSVLLKGKDHNHAFFQMSLDAIEPTRGHVPGNLRWVCWGLNCPNMDKKKKYVADDDPASAWDIDTFAAYIAVDPIIIRNNIEHAKSSGWNPNS